MTDYNLEPGVVLSNVDAERSVLGSILERPELLSTALDITLTDQDFSLEEHQKVFRCFVKMRSRGISIDSITLIESLGNSNQAVALVTDLVSGVVAVQSHFVCHVRIVQEKSALRALLNLADWIASRVYEDGANPSDIRKLAAETLRELDSESSASRIPLDAKPLDRQIV